MQDDPRHRRAVILGVQVDGVSDEEHASSLAELGRLATTLGLEVIGTVSQKRPSLAPAAVAGSGKLKELAAYTGGTGVIPSGATPQKKKQAYQGSGHEDDDDEAPPAETPGDGDGDGDGEGSAGVHAPAPHKATAVLVDHDITPSQARNLERATGAEVLDRTAVILSIFHRHARSREARLQVEIARLAYLAPRLREMGGGKERQRGGIGGRGAGESVMELDRRKIRDRIAELRREVAAIESEAGTRRKRRSEAPTVALVGYTNAGKSSLMRALTGSEVYVADKLFATLDTTVRHLVPETRPRILVSDTVGFIKKLPHDLVASFRSTLEEAREAQLLLHVVDAADGAHEAQIEVTHTVLGEIGAGDAPTLLLLNKIDRVPPERRAALAAKHPGAVMLSAWDKQDVAALHARIVAFFEAGMIDAELFVPYTQQSVASAIHERTRVLGESYEETGTRMKVRAHPETIDKLKASLQA